MSTFESRTSKTRQRGDVLLEALIGMLLMMIVGLGLSHATARATVSQRNMNLQSLAVAQMRDLIARHGETLCTDTSISKVIEIPQQDTFELSAQCSSLGINVNGVGGVSLPSSALPRKVTLSTLADDNDVFGGQIVVGN